MHIFSMSRSSSYRLYQGHRVKVKVTGAKTGHTSVTY